MERDSMRKYAPIGVAVASALTVVGVLSFAVVQERLDAERTRIDFEKLAGQLSYLSISSVLYDRPEGTYRFAAPKEREEHSALVAKATDGSYPKKALLALLQHNDPKVRTLGAVALFDREDPSVLPALVDLCADGAASFDGRLPRALAIWPTDIESPAAEKMKRPVEVVKQTMGDFAKAMVAFYMEPSGFHYGVKHPAEPGFAEYWAARRNRPHCAGWFSVQLARASQGTSPVRRTRHDRIRAVRERIDRLWPDERAWVLLWLNGETGSSALATEADLILACRRLGPGKLLLMLQNRIPSDDPDLQPRASNNWSYKRMSLFVLAHAEQLLRPDDSDALLACERWHRDYQKHGITDPTISPMWAVAAARLKPKNASAILHAAMDRFQGKHDSQARATLCAAMWHLVGRSEMEFIADWFYKEVPERGAVPHCRGAFIEAMGKDPGGSSMIARLIADSRLEDLDWQSLEWLVRVVNGWTETPVVSEEELRKAWHPFGRAHYEWSQAEAERKHPAETAQLRAVLSEWRKRLRASLPALPDTQRLPGPGVAEPSSSHGGIPAGRNP